MQTGRKCSADCTGKGCRCGDNLKLQKKEPKYSTSSDTGSQIIETNQNQSTNAAEHKNHKSMYESPKKSSLTKQEPYIPRKRSQVSFYGSALSPGDSIVQACNPICSKTANGSTIPVQPQRSIEPTCDPACSKSTIGQNQSHRFVVDSSFCDPFCSNSKFTGGISQSQSQKLCCSSICSKNGFEGRIIKNLSQSYYGTGNNTSSQQFESKQSCNPQCSDQIRRSEKLCNVKCAGLQQEQPKQTLCNPKSIGYQEKKYCDLRCTGNQQLDTNINCDPHCSSNKQIENEKVCYPTCSSPQVLGSKEILSQLGCNKSKRCPGNQCTRSDCLCWDTSLSQNPSAVETFPAKKGWSLSCCCPKRKVENLENNEAVDKSDNKERCKKKEKTKKNKKEEKCGKEDNVGKEKKGRKEEKEEIDEMPICYDCCPPLEPKATKKEKQAKKKEKEKKTTAEEECSPCCPWWKQFKKPKIKESKEPLKVDVLVEAVCPPCCPFHPQAKPIDSNKFSDVNNPISPSYLTDVQNSSRPISCPFTVIKEPTYQTKKEFNTCSPSCRYSKEQFQEETSTCSPSCRKWSERQKSSCSPNCRGANNDNFEIGVMCGPKCPIWTNYTDQPLQLHPSYRQDTNSIQVQQLSYTNDELSSYSPCCSTDEKSTKQKNGKHSCSCFAPKKDKSKKT